MAKRTGEQLKPFHFAPGQSGNPGGRPKLSPELRAISALTTQEACRIISKFARMGHGGLDAIISNPNTSSIEACVASIFSHCIANGDYTRLSFLLDRAIGRVPVAIEDDEDRAARKEIEEMSDEELLRVVAEKIPQLMKAG